MINPETTRRMNIIATELRGLLPDVAIHVNYFSDSPSINLALKLDYQVEEQQLALTSNGWITKDIQEKWQIILDNQIKGRKSAMGSEDMINKRMDHPQTGMVGDVDRTEGFGCMATRKIDLIKKAIAKLVVEFKLPISDGVAKIIDDSYYLAYPIDTLSDALRIIDEIDQNFRHSHGLEEVKRLAVVPCDNRIDKFLAAAEGLYESVHSLRATIENELTKFDLAIPLKERKKENVLDFILVCLDDIKAMLKRF